MSTSPSVAASAVAPSDPAPWPGTFALDPPLRRDLESPTPHSPIPLPRGKKCLRPLFDQLAQSSTALDNILHDLELSKQEAQNLLDQPQFPTHRQLRQRLFATQLQLAAQDHARTALNVLVEVAHSKNPLAARLAATQILTYAGLTPPPPLPDIPALPPAPLAPTAPTIPPHFTHLPIPALTLPAQPAPPARLWRTVSTLTHRLPLLLALLPSLTARFATLQDRRMHMGATPHQAPAAWAVQAAHMPPIPLASLLWSSCRAVKTIGLTPLITIIKSYMLFVMFAMSATLCTGHNESRRKLMFDDAPCYLMFDPMAGTLKPPTILRKGHTAMRALWIVSLAIGLALLGMTAKMNTSLADAVPATPPSKLLFDPTVAGAAKFITPTSDQVSADVGADGITLTLPAGVGFPGIVIKPAAGESWDFSTYGHAEAKITNLGDKKATINLQIELQEGQPPFSSDKISLAPGESKTIKVVLGYFYGQYSRKFVVADTAVKQVRIYTGKSPDVQKFRIEQVQVAGAAGERQELPPVRYRIIPKPANGVIFDTSTKIQDPKQLVGSKDGAKIAPSADGNALEIHFTGDKEQSVYLKGAWNLNEYLQVKVKLKNVGETPLTPGVQLEDINLHATQTITSKEPLAPGAQTEIIVPFEAIVPWKGLVDKAQEVADGPAKTWDKDGQPGTGTAYRSNITSGVAIISDKTAGQKQLQVISITATLPPPAQLPSWLGQKPPVEGDWVKTFDDNFDGKAIDLTKWNIYGDNYWDGWTHFSKDNTIVKDGKLILRLEKKYGDHNDDPKGKDTDYATGYADTYGKWTQRYGYFESRMKLPTAPNMFLAFWMMPDRGLKAGPQWKRSSTGKLTGALGNETGAGGMELDIMETLSIWGPYRHDFGVHWDGYAKNHKSLGMYTAYVPADKEGFITVGMLWTPGLVVMYDNGKEAARWESPRVSDIPSYFMFDLVTGGWESEPLDDSKLPADLVVDYVRAWQRKDLASDVDGPKPNQGTPAAPTK